MLRPYMIHDELYIFHYLQILRVLIFVSGIGKFKLVFNLDYCNSKDETIYHFLINRIYIMNFDTRSIRNSGISIVLVAYMFISSFVTSGLGQDKNYPVPQIDFNPEQYVCYRASEPLEINGQFDEDDWQKAIRSKYFVDIEGSLKPHPRFWTYIKMLWNDDYFYIAATIQEPHIWATIIERDAVIYQDNDFEVFIDPDGDSHNYYEVEINAFGTFWDLMLIKPYRDGGPAINAWDIYGLETGVEIDGTVNNPSDIDSQWRVEMAIPWDVLAQGAGVDSPPRPGDFWRINFSRVEWPVEISGGKYIKYKNRKTGKIAPELNWVWSPQGLINMHYPEMWGYVYFSDNIAGEGISQYELPGSEKIKWTLRQVYYGEKEYFLKNKAYTAKISELNVENLDKYQIQLAATMSLFESAIIDTTTGLTWHIKDDGLIWKTKNDSTKGEK